MLIVTIPKCQIAWLSVLLPVQVMGEDLVLVVGQQDRMLRGADVWSNPVAYDKLGVRYRRWRNSVTAGRHEERKEIENELRPMSAGELFRYVSDSVKKVCNFGLCGPPPPWSCVE